MLIAGIKDSWSENKYGDMFLTQKPAGMPNWSELIWSNLCFKPKTSPRIMILVFAQALELFN